MNNDNKVHNQNRRDFLKLSAATGISGAIGSLAISTDAHATPGRKARTEFKVPPIDPVRVGYVGVGGMGSAHVRNLLDIANKMNCVTKILYASKLGEPIYKKFGFKRKFYGEMCKLPIGRISLNLKPAITMPIEIFSGEGLLYA